MKRASQVRMLDVSPKRHGRGGETQFRGQGLRYLSFQKPLPRNVFERTKEIMRVDLGAQSSSPIAGLGHVL